MVMTMMVMILSFWCCWWWRSWVDDGGAFDALMRRNNQRILSISFYNFYNLSEKLSTFHPNFSKEFFAAVMKRSERLFLVDLKSIKSSNSMMERRRKVFNYKKLVLFYFRQLLIHFIFSFYRTWNKHKKFKWRTFNQTAVGCRTFHSECEKCSCFLLQMMRMMTTMMRMTIMTKFKLPAAAAPVISCSPFKAAPRLNPTVFHF